MAESVSFERASEYYDATRRLPGDVRDSVAEVLVAELARLAAPSRVLEIGVGTGRIALPLRARRVDVVGVDLSRAMLEKLRSKSMDVPVAQADATVLPVAARSVGAVLACHVLHLIPPWRAAVDEARRVLRPGGVLLVDMGGPHTAPWSADAVRILATHGISRARPGLTDRDELTAYLGGREPRALPAVPLVFRRSLANELDDWERQILGWTWAYSPGQMAAACADIRSWALAGGHPLYEAVEVHDAIQWWAYEAAGRGE